MFVSLHTGTGPSPTGDTEVILLTFWVSTRRPVLRRRRWHLGAPVARTRGRAVGAGEKQGQPYSKLSL